jgi:decaprenylphospho-beta-D-erythro-pentofuranosid-2-ulose 2-reductase
MSQNILIVGATSGIAEALARRYANEHAKLFLVARNTSKLEVMATDLIARGAAEVQVFAMDANNSDLISQVIETAWKSFGAIDIALVAHGTLPEQLLAESDVTYAIAEFRNNAESVIACLTLLAQSFEKQGKGVIAVIGSVAGDRGRASNYLYGSAKAAIDTYASGLRARLFAVGVHVLTIKPGFVATPMTANLNLPARLTVTPDRVAKDIQLAIVKRKDVLYTPWFWGLIMLIIRCVPTLIFKRLKF